MPHVELPQAEFKVVLLGDTNTGKTSLVLRFVEGHYRAAARSATLGAFFLTKRVTVQQMTCKMLLWDTAGQEAFHKLAVTYYKTAAAVILTYDISQPHSLWKLRRQWLEEVRKNTASRQMVLVLCACKSDLEPSPGLVAEAQRLAASIGALHVETSAKNNDGVAQLFSLTAERVLQCHRDYVLGQGPSIPVTLAGSTNPNGSSTSNNLRSSFTKRQSSGAPTQLPVIQDAEPNSNDNVDMGLASPSTPQNGRNHGATTTTTTTPLTNYSAASTTTSLSSSSPSTYNGGHQQHHQQQHLNYNLQPNKNGLVINTTGLIPTTNGQKYASPHHTNYHSKDQVATPVNSNKKNGSETDSQTTGNDSDDVRERTKALRNATPGSSAKSQKKKRSSPQKTGEGRIMAASSFDQESHRNMCEPALFACLGGGGCSGTNATGSTTTSPTHCGGLVDSEDNTSSCTIM